MPQKTGYSGLTRYDVACRAIAESCAVDDVREIHDVAVAMAVYARRAKNRDLEADAAEIRLRATRRIGQLMREQAETGERVSAGRPAPRDNRSADGPLTLAEQGIDKHLADAARALERIGDDEFGALLDRARRVAREAPNRVLGSARRRAELAERVARDVREQIEGTPLDSDVGLEYLGGLDEEQQRERVAVLMSDEAAEWEPDEAASARLARLTVAWDAAEEQERRAFLACSLGVVGEWVSLEEAELLIDRARRALGWSMEELDARAGLAERHASKLLIRGRKPSKKRLGPTSMMRIARAMGASNLFRVPV